MSLYKEHLLELRRHKRYRFGSLVEIRWIGADGTKYSSVGSGLDISLFGMAVEVSASIPVGTQVAIRIDRIELQNKATIKYSRQIRFGVRVGMEFQHSLASEDLINLNGKLDALQNEVLAACSQSARPEPRRSAVLTLMRKTVCSVTRHVLEWRSDTAGRTTLVCSRCGSNANIYAAHDTAALAASSTQA